MNLGTHEVRNKKVYNKHLLDPLLVSLLEKWSGGKLEKLLLEIPNRDLQDPGWYRWRLEGIKDTHYRNCTGYDTSTFLGAVRLPLQELLGDDLLRVVRKWGCSDLILDFRTFEGIFQKINPEKAQELEGIDLTSLRKPERKKIRIPIITCL